MIYQTSYLLAILAGLAPSIVTARPGAQLVRNPSEAASTEDCSTDTARNTTWSVSGLTYRSSIVFSTPAHQIDGGEVLFNVTSTATGPDAGFSCYAHSSQLHDFFYGNMWYSCDPVNPPAEDSPSSAVRFMFNRPTGELVLNQAWRCSGPDPQYPTAFNATGSADTALNCKTTFWQNPNWTMGSTYSSETVNCDPADLSVKASVITAVA